MTTYRSGHEENHTLAGAPLIFRLTLLFANYPDSVLRLDANFGQSSLTMRGISLLHPIGRTRSRDLEINYEFRCALLEQARIWNRYFEDNTPYHLKADGTFSSPRCNQLFRWKPAVA